MNSPTSTPSKRSPNKFRDYEIVNKKLYTKLNPGVDFKLWEQIIHESNKQIGEYILTTPLGFKLPNRLGLLIVLKRKVNTFKKGYIDRKHFCQTGEKKPQLNLHTFGYTYTIKWMQQDSTIFTLRTIYKFKAVRALNRMLAKLILTGKDNYFDTQSKHDFTAIC